MSKRARFIVISVLTLWVVGLQAQDHDPVKDIIESLAENLADDYDLSELSERLNYHLKHPIDLNKASPAQLKELVFLSPLQISNLIEHISNTGRLADVLELQAIDGFDLQTINRMLPFITTGIPSGISGLNLPDLYAKGSHDLILRYGRILETQKGFTDLPGSRYLGTPDKLLLRYKYNYDDFLSAALVTEKDAGEYLFRKKSGADHLSFHISFRTPGRVKKLVIGDYSLQFGQGLTLWSGFSFGKGPDVTSVASKDIGLRAYNSSNEASFFRGLASTVGLSPNFDLTSFVSFRKLDASVKYPSDGHPTLQNINISGLHRTATELKNQKSLEQLVYGMVLQYTADHLNAGLVGYKSDYQHEFVTGTQLYNKYGFTGRQLINTGFHYNYTFKNIYFYGEWAHSLYSGWAFVNGALASLSSKVSVVVLHRNYDRDYHNFFGSGIGEATEISNEKGIYTGLNYMPSGRWTFSAYSDYFRFPWLKYRIDSASSGYELLGQAAFTPNKRFKALIRYKREVKQQNPDAGSKFQHLERVKKQSFRLDWNWQINKEFNLHQRAEMSNYQKGGQVPETAMNNEYGFLIFQDADYKPARGLLSGNVRVAYFRTPSYDSRIYAYEDNVLYGASSGAYNGKGIRAYLNVRYRLIKSMDVWARYAVYLYQDMETIGSGLDEINGRSKSDVRIQLRYQF
ncbi:helix-hairpin-helix domain-containing protein [Pedobacter ginsengisoli]|uniref:helix-hairpin-helix domain-containing protein n=1 Tax=Pedobacter ginsengisoli TaxID=363852 RepID=UPI00254F5AB8|nr:helix-hairpin-helix domain-containing protein [Pedobacter ginsengisoli]